MASSPRRVDLVRHAQDESARVAPTYHPLPNSPLTEHGIEQANAAAQNLATDYTGIVYSPILRAEQTARLFSAATGVPLLAKMPCIGEWRPPSSVYGKSPDEYDLSYRRWRYARATDPALAYEDGESLLALHKRAALAVRELIRLAAATGPLLVVSHKVFLGAVVYRDLGPAEAFHFATSEPWAHCEVRTLDPQALKEA